MSNKSKESEHQKKISEQFAGLEMEMLIGAPLMEACAAQLQLAKETSEFLKEVVFPKSEQKKQRH